MKQGKMGRMGFRDEEPIFWPQLTTWWRWDIQVQCPRLQDQLVGQRGCQGCRRNIHSCALLCQLGKCAEACLDSIFHIFSSV